MPQKGVSQEVFWMTVILVVMTAVAVITFAFFSGENPLSGENSLGSIIFKGLLCDMLYFFFGPACAYYGA